MDIKAYDLGEPSLSSVTTVPVYVRHTATVAPEAGLGFADDEYSVEVAEDARANQLVKTISVLNARVHNVPLKCEIISGNNEGKSRKFATFFFSYLQQIFYVNNFCVNASYYLLQLGWVDKKCSRPPRLCYLHS